MAFMHRRPVRTLPLLLLAGALALPAAAEDTVAVVPEDLDSIRTLDEVVVTGRLNSLTAARQAVIEAENRFYARFNELNKTQGLDIGCSVEAPTGSRLTRRNCQTRLGDDLNRNEALKFIGVAEGSVVRAPPPDLKPQLMARTLELVKKDPELLRALLERARLQQHYEALLAEKFADQTVVLD
jgi:hypothetical protein